MSRNPLIHQIKVVEPLVADVVTGKLDVRQAAELDEQCVTCGVSVDRASAIRIRVFGKALLRWRNPYDQLDEMLGGGTHP